MEEEKGTEGEIEMEDEGEMEGERELGCVIVCGAPSPIPLYL